MNLGFVIPAYNPGPGLAAVVDELLCERPCLVVVVDDGSDRGALCLPETAVAHPGLTVLRHARNRGKGAAIKTGLRAVYEGRPDLGGVVLLDADGQHRVADALRVGRALAEDGEGLVLGVRAFRGEVPWKSRFGNALARRLVRALSGLALADTQCGLRGVPRAMIPSLLGLPGEHYDFETEMLLQCRREGLRIVEVPIDTVYLEGNRLSFFRPVVDSLRIARAISGLRGGRS